MDWCKSASTSVYRNCAVIKVSSTLGTIRFFPLLVAAFDNSKRQLHPELRIYSPRQGIHSPVQEIYR
jgi:hypothetical protein